MQLEEVPAGCLINHRARVTMKDQVISFITEVGIVSCKILEHSGVK